MGLARATGRLFRRVLGTGPGAGALVLSLLFALDLFGASLDFMGFSDEKATNRILGRYGAHIVVSQLVILATYLVVGALLGGAGSLIGRAWDWARLRSTTRLRSTVRGALTALGGHLVLLAHHITHYPQLYSEALYDRGGVRRAIMVALTDQAWTSVAYAALVALVVGLIVGPTFIGRGRAATAGLAEACRAQARLHPRVAIAAAGVILCVGAAGLLHTRAPAIHSGDPKRPNLLLIAVDSLRADRVFAPDAASRFPALAALAARGVRFREQHVTVPRTFPSFVTLLTGRYPHHHGIRHMFPPEAARRAIGPALPWTLREAGYHTIVLSDYAGEIFSRTPLGFRDIGVPYFDMKTIVDQRGLQVHPNVLPYATSSLGRRLFPAVDALPERSDPALLADRAIAKLDDAGKTPFFMTLFFSAAHFPYAAPSPYYHRFTDPGYAGPFKYQKPPLATAAVTPADAQQIRGLYDGAVAATSDAVARVLKRLDEDGLADNTIVVLLADHGENLYEGDGRGMGHGDHLSGSAADHVPLVIVDPTRHFPPHDVPGITRDVDVAPTLAALLSVKLAATDGADLLPLLRGDKPTLDLDAFAETEFWFTDSGPGFQPDERLPYPGITGSTDLADDGDIFIKPEWQDTIVVAKHRAIRSGHYKLVYQPTRTGVRWRLYDLAADPDEQREVSAAHPEVVAALRKKLETWMTSDGRTVMRGGFAVPR